MMEKIIKKAHSKAVAILRESIESCDIDIRQRREYGNYTQ